MTTPETTNPEVLAAAREAYAKCVGARTGIKRRIIVGDFDRATGMLVAIAAINEYRRSGSGVVKVLSNDLTRPIVGIENRTAQEVFDMMCDRILRSALAEPAAREATFQHRVQPEATCVRYRIDHDGFDGDVIGSYVTREGKRGVVLQQIGTKVVHVYGEKWLSPSNGGK